MRRALVICAALALAIGALAVAGCGGQKRTIPTRTAESFLRQLDNIASQVDAKACSGAHAKVAALLAQARQLPSSVDPTVRRNVVAGIARLDTLVARDCQKPPPQTNTNTAPTVPTQTVPTTTPTNTLPTTTPTQTAPPPTSTTPPPTSTTPPPTTGGGGVTVPGTTGAGGASLDLGRGHGKDHRGNSGGGGG